MSVSTDVVVYAVGALAAVFGILGYLRGWRREAIALAGLLVAWGLVVFAGRPMVWLVDRVWLVLGFAFGGGFDTADANGLLRDLRAHPLVDPTHPYPLYAVVFVALTIGAYYLGARYASPGDVVAGIIGALVGLLNGYLISCALLSYVAPAFFGRDLSAAAAVVGRYSTPALVLGAGVVAVALIAVLRGRGSSSRRPARARGR